MNWYRLGVEEAKREIANEYVTIYETGAPKVMLYDTEFGLPVTYLPEPINDIVEDRIKGHNEYLRNYVAVSGLPKNSLTKWNDIILNPQKYFAQTDLKKTAFNPPYATATSALLQNHKVTVFGQGAQISLHIERKDTGKGLSRWEPSFYSQDGKFGRIEIADGPETTNLLFIFYDDPAPLERGQSGTQHYQVWETVGGILLNQKWIGYQ